MTVLSHRRSLLILILFGCGILVTVFLTLPYGHDSLDYLKEKTSTTWNNAPWFNSDGELNETTTGDGGFNWSHLAGGWGKGDAEEASYYDEDDTSPLRLDQKDQSGHLPGYGVPILSPPTSKTRYRTSLEGRPLSSGPDAKQFPPSNSHHPTFGFSHIYVLSLPHRVDRRKRMLKLAKALGIELVFVDATDAKEPMIQWIGERAKEIRDIKKPELARAWNVPESEIGGMGPDTVWLTRDGEVRKQMSRQAVKFEEDLTQDGRWKDHETGRKNIDWVTYLESHPDPHSLTPSDPNLNVTATMWDYKERNDFRQIREAVIATWWSQTRVWELMKANDDDVALVLEDDVDLEWDLERIWRSIERRMPLDWEVLFLGHCWGRELTKPASFHPLVHPSSEPRCLHGYALSRAGYNHLTSLLADPWVAYTAAVDTALPNMIQKRVISKAYSVEPCLIIQSKDQRSDIQQGIGSPWRGVLMDSTLERIWMEEGKWDLISNYDEGEEDDPATKFRPSLEEVSAKAAAKEMEKELARLKAEAAKKEEEEAKKGFKKVNKHRPPGGRIGDRKGKNNKRGLDSEESFSSAHQLVKL